MPTQPPPEHRLHEFINERLRVDDERGLHALDRKEPSRLVTKFLDDSFEDLGCTTMVPSSFGVDDGNGAFSTHTKTVRLCTKYTTLAAQMLAGLEGRSWYKHHIYAPGFYTGYGVKTIPGVREAIEQREFEKVAAQIDIAANVLNDMAERIELLSSMIGGD